MLVARETFLAAVAFKLRFSSYGLGDAELATGPSNKNTERGRGYIEIMYC